MQNDVGLHVANQKNAVYGSRVRLPFSSDLNSHCEKLEVHTDVDARAPPTTAPKGQWKGAFRDVAVYGLDSDDVSGRSAERYGSDRRRVRFRLRCVRLRWSPPCTVLIPLNSVVAAAT